MKTFWKTVKVAAKWYIKLTIWLWALIGVGNYLGIATTKFMRGDLGADDVLNEVWWNVKTAAEGFKLYVKTFFLGN